MKASRLESLKPAAAVLLFLLLQPLPGPVAAADSPPAPEPVFYLDFTQPIPELELVHGARIVSGDFGAALEFNALLQYAEIPFSHALHEAEAVTIGGWFYPRRQGEQYFFFRGVPETAPGGERMFRPQPDWINFVLGADQRGFFLGTIHGNGSMPFPHVTLNEVKMNGWNQLVLVKDEDGYQHFYMNGRLIHADTEAEAAGVIRPFHDQAPGEPVRLAMPLGGRIGEVWIYNRELTSSEIRRDFESKKDKYHPAHPQEPVQLREMNYHPAAHLWPEPVTRENWPRERERIRQGALKVLGPFPEQIAPLEPRIHSEEDMGHYIRRKISIQVQPDDRMPAYLLVPKGLLESSPAKPAPAIICFYGTTSGAGKKTTVGISGPRPGSPPVRNRAFAIDMVEAGLVALAPDYLRDGERVQPGRRPYDTTDFYEQFPDWSIHGKDAWDTSRAIDYLETLDFVDPDRIGMIGHSYGGHGTLFTAAFEPRIRVAVANGPVSDFRHHGLHWGVPKGAGNSQSLPAMRPYVLDHTLPIPVTFYEFTALIAPRPLLVGQAAGERRPMEEENHAAVRQVYQTLGYPERVSYLWYPGDHDFPSQARRAAVCWFKRWFGDPLPVDR